jgi:hypothetical protein
MAGCAVRLVRRIPVTTAMPPSINESAPDIEAESSSGAVVRAGEIDVIS